MTSKISETTLTLRWSIKFRLTYLGGGGGGASHPLEILTIACLTFCLFFTDIPTLGLPEYKLKVVNICKMDGTGVMHFLIDFNDMSKL